VAAVPIVELGQAAIAERPYLTEQNTIMLTLQGYYGADQQVPAPEPRSPAGPLPGWCSPW